MRCICYQALTLKSQNEIMRYFVIFVFCLTLTLAQDLNPDRFYYRGTVGTEPRQLELVINNQELSGSVIHSGQVWRLEGNWAYRGPATLHEIDAEGQKGGLWLAKIDTENYASTLTGMYDHGEALPFELTKVADYVTSQWIQSRIEATVHYPFFLSPVLFNEVIQTAALEEQQSFFLEGQDDEAKGEMSNGWSLESDYHIHYASETVLSLLNTRSFYTGGAHPNMDYVALNYHIKDNNIIPLGLDQLIPDHQDKLIEYITNELKGQDAAWIIDGSEVLDKFLLTRFTFSPLGFSFYFPPYAVGPYVQGPFEVSVSLKTLESLGIENNLLSFMQ